MVHLLDALVELAQLGFQARGVLLRLPLLRGLAGRLGRRRRGLGRLSGQLADGAPVVEVGIDAAGQQHAGAVAHERVDDVADALEKVAVVAHHEQGAGPGVQVVLDDGEGVDVEVVGGLVQQQHVRLVHEQAQELQASAFTAGEFPDAGHEPVADKAEVFEELGCGRLLAGRQLRLALEPVHRVEDALGVVQLGDGLRQVR